MIYIAYIFHSERNRDKIIFVEGESEQEVSEIALEEAENQYGEFGRLNYIVPAEIFVHSNEHGSGRWINLNNIK